MIRIMLHDLDRDRILSYRESQRMVESFWEFCHKDCCGINVEYRQKEIWFCECHEEHRDDECRIDSVEWIWEVFFMGVKIR